MFVIYHYHTLTFPLTDSWTFAQHDPDDEPFVAPLDPEYFDFDRMYLSLSNEIENETEANLLHLGLIVQKEELTKPQLRGMFYLPNLRNKRKKIQ